MSAEAAGGSSPRAPRRTDRRDPRLPLADMFDPVIAQRLWESLPEECRVDHIDKKNIPEIYRGAIKLVSVGGRASAENRLGPWTSCSINFRDLPDTMTWEIAWLIHREIELGRYIHPNMFNAAVRVLRIATAHGTKRGRSAASLLHLTPEEWVREVQFARMRGIDFRLKQRQTRGTPAPSAPGRSGLSLSPRPVVGTQCVEPSTRFPDSATRTRAERAQRAEFQPLD